MTAATGLHDRHRWINSRSTPARASCMHRRTACRSAAARCPAPNDRRRYGGQRVHALAPSSAAC
eukprot:11562928-Alexandrium_andersonii.AAC.1